MTVPEADVTTIATSRIIESGESTILQLLLCTRDTAAKIVSIVDAQRASAVPFITIPPIRDQLREKKRAHRNPMNAVSALDALSTEDNATLWSVWAPPREQVTRWIGFL